jgi:carbonic anhydrase/acetyltransferase-like protein (isoleucine patch superfamily)
MARMPPASTESVAGGEAAPSNHCPGVSIGENTAVGAGSIVTRSLPAGVVAFGNPARAVREIGDRDRVNSASLQIDASFD